MRLLLPFFFFALACGGCVAPAKKYSAPDFRKVDAAAKRQDEAHRKLSATTVRAEVKVAAAQKNADTIAGHSANIVKLVYELEQLVPLELAPRFAELKTAVQAEQSEAGELVTNLSGAQREIGQLKLQDLPEAAAAKAASDAAVAEVKIESEKTADAATSESARRYKAESQLWQQKLWRKVWQIGRWFLLLGLIALIVLWWFGKISWAGVKTYAGIR